MESSRDGKIVRGRAFEVMRFLPLRGQNSRIVATMFVPVVLFGVQEIGMRVAVLLLCLVAPVALAADSNRIIALEQDVRNLERLVSTLQREVRELRQHARGSAGRGGATLHDEPAATSDAWLSAAKWQALRVGASEMEVIEALGPPTSMRVENGSRILLYAMEIGTTGFLSGSVTLKDREVVAIEAPVLK